MHFGAELSESTKRTLAMGDRITSLFDQSYDKVIPVTVSVFLIAVVWGGNWKDTAINEMKRQAEAIVSSYSKDSSYKMKVDEYVTGSTSFDDLVTKIRSDDSILNPKTTNTN
jgi:F0F1-type ATP synthase alpha subunit